MKPDQERAAGDGKARAADGGDELVIPIIEEELRVGTREVERGGVRIATHVNAVPVEKTVTIRDERVTIERRVVDRPIDPKDEAFRDRMIDLEAMSEEPVITKRVHVVEEIRIHKERTERTERIDDTLRHTEVEISNLPGTRVFDAAPYEDHFRQRYGANHDFKKFAPAYEFGERTFRANGGEWTNAEAFARGTWEKQNPGTWDRYGDAVRAGWMRAAGRR